MSGSALPVQRLLGILSSSLSAPPLVAVSVSQKISKYNFKKNGSVMSMYHEALGFSTYSVLSCANSDSFIYSFLIWRSFISSPCLIAVAWTLNTMLNKSGKSKGILVLLLFLEETFSTFHY